MTGTVGLGAPPQPQTDPYKTWLDRGATPGQALGLTGQVPSEPESMGGPAPAEQLFEILPGKEKEYEDAKAKIKRHVQQKYGKVLSDDEADRIARGGNLQTTLSIPTLENLDQQTRLALLESEQTGTYRPVGGGPAVKTMAREKQEYAQGAEAGYATLPIVTADMLGVTAVKVGANMPVPDAIAKQVGERFKAVIGIDATPDQVQTLARGGELRNILVPSTTGRQLEQGEAALMGELDGKLTLAGKTFNLNEWRTKYDVAMAEGDRTGIYVDPFSGGHVRKQTLESQRLQLETYKTRGYMGDGTEILALRLAKMDDKTARDTLFGFYDVTRRDKDGNPLRIYGNNEIAWIAEKAMQGDRDRQLDWEVIQNAGGDFVDSMGNIQHIVGREEAKTIDWNRSEMARNGYYEIVYDDQGKPQTDPRTGEVLKVWKMGTQGLAKYEIDLQVTLNREARRDAAAQYAVANQLDRDRFVEEQEQFDSIQRLKEKEYWEKIREFASVQQADKLRWADQNDLALDQLEFDKHTYEQNYKLEYLRYGQEVQRFRKQYKQEQERVDNQNAQFYAGLAAAEKRYAGYDQVQYKMDPAHPDRPLKDKDGNPIVQLDNNGRPVTKHIFGEYEMELERLDVQRTLTVKGFDAERARQLADHLHDREMISGWEEVYTKPDGTAGTRRVMGSQDWTTFTQDREARIQVIMREGGKIVVPNGTNSDGTTKYETLYVTGSAQLAETAADKDWQRRMKEEYGYWDPSERDSKGNPVFRSGRLTRQITLLETQADITDRLARWAAIRQNAHDVLMANTQWNQREKELAWESAEKILDRANGERMAALLGQREMAQENRADVRARQAADDTRDLLFIQLAGNVVGNLGSALLKWGLKNDIPDNWADTLGNLTWLKANFPGRTDAEYQDLVTKFGVTGAEQSVGAPGVTRAEGRVDEAGNPVDVGDTGVSGTQNVRAQARSGDRPITPGTFFQMAAMGLAGMGKGMTGMNMSGAASFATDVVAMLPVALGLMNPVAGIAYLVGQGFGAWLSSDKSNQVKRQQALRAGLWTTQPTQGMLTGIENKLPEGTAERGKVRVRFDFDTDFDPNTAAPDALPQLKVSFYSPAAGTFYEESYDQFVTRTKIMPFSFVGAEDTVYNQVPDSIKQKFKNAGWKPSYALVFEDGGVTFLARPGKNGIQKSFFLTAEEAKPILEAVGSVAADQDKRPDAVNDRGVTQLDQVRADAVKGSAIKATELDAVANGLSSDAKRLRFWKVVSKAEPFTNADIDYIFGTGMAIAQSTAYNLFLGLVGPGKLQWDKQS